MSLDIGIGQAFTLEGRDAVADAIYDAMGKITTQKVALAMIFTSSDYDIQSVLSGAATQLGNTPLIGFSTSGEITDAGSHHRSVVVVLFGGEGIEGKTEWLPGFSENSINVAQKMVESLQLNQLNSEIVFVVPDGLNGDSQELVQNLSLFSNQAAGCLAGGDLQKGHTFQIGGGQAGTGGLAGMALKGRNLKLGVGAAHGWESVGAYFKITSARGPWVRGLNGKLPSESYAALFGRRARDWAFPPLNTLVRLYPLGVEQDENDDLLVRTPVRIESDGSLRMNTQIKDGAIGHLLVGRAEKCMDAARQAASDARKQLGSAKPKLALIFADVSWQMLLKGQPGSEIQAVQEILGKDVPIAGAYTFGQLAPTNGTNQLSLLNQHIEVILIGEEEND